MNKILLIQTAFIGDVILATALLESLHKTFPTAQIDIFVRKGNEVLFHHHPYLHHVWVWDKTIKKYQGLASLLLAIHKKQFDLVINMQRFAATGILTAFSGAKKTIGFDKNPFSFLFSKKIRHEMENGVHEVDRNLKLIRHLKGVERCLPKLYPHADEYKKVAGFPHEPYVCLAPTSVWFTKQVPGKIWIALIRKLTRRYRVYLLGGPEDFKTCERIRSQSHEPARITNLSGKLSLLQSAALMKGARMNYVNDSAPMHLASAMDAPVTSVFCSTVPEFGFGPLSTDSRIVQTHVKLPCKPCGIHGKENCPEGHFKCGNTILVEDLLFKA